MNQSPSGDLSLAGAQLGQLRHVCAFFHSQDEEYQVLMPFIKEGIERGESQTGAGLGLAICKGIIKAHGGSIWIQDTPPPGTTISFTLPVAAS